VTGGNIGLGKQAILYLAQHEPTTIWLGARNKDKATAAIADIKKAVGPSAPDIRFLEIDLTSFASIKAAARTFRDSSDRLDILMLNAGIMATGPGLTKDGYEIQFGTNHVGHALLTKLLMPKLLDTAKQPNADVRVVVLSSGAHRAAPSDGVRFDKLKMPDCGGMSNWTRYGQSKLANILYARQLAKEYPQLKTASIHPGGVNTNLITHSEGLLAGIVRPLVPLLGKTVEEGAKNQVWAATAKEGVVSGEYYHPVGVTGQDSALAKDQNLTKKLWDWTVDELKGHDI
jgi:retinol dehydrogenase 12